MRLPQETILAHIDSLCARDCSFALCRYPHTDVDELFMQTDGGHTDDPEAPSLLRPEQRDGFLIAPFSSQRPALFIREEAVDIAAIADSFELLAEEESSALPSPQELKEHYHAQFTHYKSELQKRGSLQKLVLSRWEDVACQGISPAQLYIEACQRHPRSLCTLFHSKITGTWLCCSPELFVRGGQGHWYSMALAGTQMRGSVWDEKNKREQEFVAQSIRELLQKRQITFKESPLRTQPVGDIEHLCTPFEFSMDIEGLAPLLQDLHPTPAIGGYPQALAKDFIETHPDMDRAYYTGYFGVYRPQAESRFHVTLRCMRLGQKACRLYAGGGILPESLEVDEWQETALKMEAMRHLLAPSLL